jgi:DtxR family Mn-dependent transcriptional regulator
LISLTKNEEDYLKALFYLSIEQHEESAGTNQLATHLGFSAASVNGMLKKLRTKNLVDYEKYGKVQLTEEGKSLAVKLVRKHRLWETFLVKYMNFKWHEVHEVAEQLEHIHSQKLIDELDRMLGYPKSDPHGDPIPDAGGDYNLRELLTLADMKVGERCRLVSVKDSSALFLKYVAQIGLALSSDLEITELREFDGSMRISFGGKSENISGKFAENVFVERLG